MPAGPKYLKGNHIKILKEITRILAYSADMDVHEKGVHPIIKEMHILEIEQPLLLSSTK